MIVVCINDNWENFDNIPGPHPVKDNLYEVVSQRKPRCSCGCGRERDELFYSLRECRPSAMYLSNHFTEVEINIADIEVKEEVYAEL